MLGMKAAPGLQLLLGTLQGIPALSGWKTRIPPPPPLSELCFCFGFYTSPSPPYPPSPPMTGFRSSPSSGASLGMGMGGHPNSWGLSVGFGCGMGTDITGPKYAARLRVGSVGSNTSV